MAALRAKPFSLGRLSLNYLEAEGFTRVAHQRLGIRSGDAAALTELLRAAPSVVTDAMLDGCAKVAAQRDGSRIMNRTSGMICHLRDALVDVGLDGRWIRRVRGSGYALDSAGVWPIYDFVVYHGGPSGAA